MAKDLNQPGAYNVNWQKLLEESKVSLGGGGGDSLESQTLNSLVFGGEGATFTVGTHSGTRYKKGDAYSFTLRLVNVTSNGQATNGWMSIDGIPDAPSDYTAVSIVNLEDGQAGLSAYMENQKLFIPDGFYSGTELIVSGSWHKFSSDGPSV